MTVTIKQVAKHAGVSPKTVSRVINNEIYVSETTKAKVLEAIKELGYSANISAKRLSSGRAYTIGLIFHNASWHYIQDVQRGVLETALENGYSTLMHPCDLASSQDWQEILSLVTQNQVDGFIFTPPADNADQLMAELTGMNFPFVRLTPSDRESPLPYVAATDKQGAFDLTKYLISLGHKRIGYVYGPKEQRAAHDRFDGYKHALLESNIVFDEDLIGFGDDHYESGFQAAKNLIDKDLKPTAIFCNNDEMASGAIAAVFESGFNVPGDISVAGFDNIPLARQIWPPLTTIEQPIKQIAELATNHLITMLNSESLPVYHKEVPTKLIIRKSTGPVLTS